MLEDPSYSPRYLMPFLIGLGIVLVGISFFIINSNHLFTTIEDMNVSYMELRSQTVIQQIKKFTAPVTAAVAMDATFLVPEQNESTLAQQFQSVIEPQLELNPQIARMYLADTHGNEWLAAPESDGSVKIRLISRMRDDQASVLALESATRALDRGDYHKASELIAPFERITRILIGTDTKEHDRTITSDIPLDPRNELWYLQALRDRTPTWTPPSRIKFGESERVKNRRYITVSAPILKDGTVVGVMGADILLDDLSVLIDVSASPFKGLVLVFDQAGNLIHSPENASFLNSSIPRDQRTMEDINDNQFGYILNARETELQRVMLDSGYYNSYRVSIAGNDGPKDWNLLLLTPESQFAGPLRNNVLVTILLTVMLLSLIIYLTVFNAVLIRHPSASRDSLTGILNRRFFQDAVDKQLRLCSENSSRVFSLVLIDIDHFTALNGMYGQQFGDSLLIDFGRFLNGQVNSPATVARIQDDEFALLLPDCNMQDAFKRTEEIRRGYEDHKAIQQDPTLILTTFSAGIVCATTYGSTFDQLMNAAERVLLEAKACGKNQTLTAR